MTFADLASGDSVFVDANTLVYHCTLDPVLGSACTDLLDRIGRGEIAAFTSTHILLEVAHRLMTLEAARLLGKPQGSMAKFLKGHLDEIQRLTSFRQAIEDLCIGRLQILATSPAMVPTIAALSQQICLLTNDAAVVAIMQSSGLPKIASNDPDFDRVPGLTRYAPVSSPAPLLGGVLTVEAVLVARGCTVVAGDGREVEQERPQVVDAAATRTPTGPTAAGVTRWCPCFT